MKLPIDIPTLLMAAIDIDKACSISVSANILIDESATPEFQVFVRSGFNSESANSRVMVSYFPTQAPDEHVESDIAVIAAGSSPAVGEIAARFRNEGRPTLVVAEQGEAVRSTAAASGHAIPEEDLICIDPGCKLDEELRCSLADRIGTWIVRADAEKRLAFSIAYPFVRRPLAYESIRATALQNAGVGVVVFVPGADMPIMTANQAKMVLQIAAAYGHPLSTDRVKELVGVIAGGFVFRGVSRQLAGAVPALGWAVKGTMGYIGTQAIGHAAIEYFEGGGDVAGLAALVGKVSSTAAETAETVASKPAVKTVVSAVAPKAKKAALVALDAAAPVAKSAAKVAWKSMKPGSKKKGKRQ